MESCDCAQGRLSQYSLEYIRLGCLLKNRSSRPHPSNLQKRPYLGHSFDEPLALHETAVYPLEWDLLLDPLDHYKNGRLPPSLIVKLGGKVGLAEPRSYKPGVDLLGLIDFEAWLSFSICNI